VFGGLFALTAAREGSKTMLDLAAPNLLRPSQVASRPELSVSRIRQLAEAGQLPCIETPYGRLFREDVVQAFIREREQNGHQVAEPG
jgi:hypothetical protein